MIGDWFLRYRDRVAVWYWPVLLVQLVWLRAWLIAEIVRYGPDTMLCFSISPTGRVTIQDVVAPPAEPPEPQPEPPRPVKAVRSLWPESALAVPYLDSS